MLQIEGKPCRNLQHVEPSVEPSLEPTGAREPGDAGFEKAFAAFAVCGQRRSHMDRSRAAWALWSGRIAPDLLIAAIVRFTAEDPDLKRGVCKGFEGWLNGEVFRHWLPGQAVADGEPTDPRARFAGPVDLFDQLVAAGASPALLGFSRWDAESREIRTRSATAAKKLEAAVSIPVCRALNIKFVKAADLAAGGNA